MPLFASTVVSLMGGIFRERRTYITMIQDGQETARNGLERRKGVRGFLHQIDG